MEKFEIFPNGEFSSVLFRTILVCFVMLRAVLFCLCSLTVWFVLFCWVHVLFCNVMLRYVHGLFSSVLLPFCFQWLCYSSGVLCCGLLLFRLRSVLFCVLFWSSFVTVLLCSALLCSRSAGIRCALGVLCAILFLSGCGLLSFVLVCCVRFCRGILLLRCVWLQSWFFPFCSRSSLFYFVLFCTVCVLFCSVFYCSVSILLWPVCVLFSNSSEETETVQQSSRTIQKCSEQFNISAQYCKKFGNCSNQFNTLGNSSQQLHPAGNCFRPVCTVGKRSETVQGSANQLMYSPKRLKTCCNIWKQFRTDWKQLKLLPGV